MKNLLPATPLRKPHIMTRGERVDDVVDRTVGGLQGFPTEGQIADALWETFALADIVLSPGDVLGREAVRQAALESVLHCGTPLSDAERLVDAARDGVDRLNEEPIEDTWRRVSGERAPWA